MQNIREQQALESIRQQMADIPGHLGFYYKNLVTGYEFGVHEDEVFGAASVMKLPLYMHILSESAAGRMDMNEKLTVTDADKVPICGALTLFTGEVTADVRTLCRLMISISDNTATNKLIRHATIEGASAGFRAMGLEKTVLRRCLFDREASKRGLQNYICPKEIGMLLEKLYRNEFVSEAGCKEIIDTLLLQQVEELSTWHPVQTIFWLTIAVSSKTMLPLTVGQFISLTTATM